MSFPANHTPEVTDGVEGLLVQTVSKLSTLSGGIVVTSEAAAEATATAPAYTEGQDAPLSQDLSGRLRTLATISDGANVAQGTTTDAPVGDNTTVASATAATGIGLWKRIVNLLIAMLAVEGTTAGAAVITDANGTIQQYLRGLIKQWIAGTLVIGTGSNTIGAVTNVPLTDFGAGEYETVAAGQTDQILGPTGGVGDWLSGILIVPGTTSPGAVTAKDGNGSAISIFAGGTSSVSNLVPFFVPFGAKTVNGTTPGWKITTGTNVTAVGFGNFT